MSFIKSIHYSEHPDSPAPKSFFKEPVYFFVTSDDMLVVIGETFEQLACFYKHNAGKMNLETASKVAQWFAHGITQRSKNNERY